MSEMRNLRFRLGLTLDDIYVATGRKIEPGALSRIERGIVEPSEDKKELIAKALGAKVADVFPPNGDAMTLDQERSMFQKLRKVMTLQDRVKLLHGPGRYQDRLLAMAEKYRAKL